MKDFDGMKDDDSILEKDLDSEQEMINLEETKIKRKYTSRKYMKKQLVCGHDDKPYHAKGLCKNCYQRELERRKFSKTGAKRKNKPIVYKCPHVTGQAYKNKMCKSCCWENGIRRRGLIIDRCEHTDKKHYGRGLCRKCYRHEEYLVFKG